MNDKLTLVKTRLWDLAMEQHDKGNKTMGFVLDDIEEKVKEVISEIRREEEAK